LTVNAMRPQPHSNPTGHLERVFRVEGCGRSELFTLS
jgi:hypothetical protein